MNGNEGNQMATGEMAGGRRVLICLAEARDVLARACRGAAEIVDVRTSDGRGAFVALLAESDASRFLAEPGVAGLVLQR